MSQDERLLIAVEQWYTKNWDTLVSKIAAISLRPRSTNRSKNNVSIEFETAESAVSAVFWDSGESEVITVSKRDQDPPAVNPTSVASPEDVAAVLDRIRDLLLRESS